MTRPTSTWIIRESDGRTRTVPGLPDEKPHVPEDLPTYRKLNCIHSGNPRMEVRLRAASLQDSCRHMNANQPRRAMMYAIHLTGRVNEDQARELRDFIQRDGQREYLINETLLLLEAGGHVKEDGAE